MLVYDVTKKTTFTNVNKWLTDLKQFAEPDCIIMLVANKVDLVERNPKKREVSTEDGRQLAKENKMLFMETSALASYKVAESFEDLLQGKKIFLTEKKYTMKGEKLQTQLSTKDIIII